MKLILYNNKSPKNKIGKILTNPYNLTGTLRAETSTTNLQIFIEAIDLNPYNYLYISEFNRYYFITDVISVRTGLWLVNASIDVLESFKSEILSLNVILDTTENTGAKEYKSGECWDILVKEKTDIVSFSNGLLNTGEFILITAGG